MASVRITQSIVDHARQRIRELYLKQIDENGKRINNINAQELIWRTCEMTPADIQKIKELPINWVCKINSMSIVFNDPVTSKQFSASLVFDAQDAVFAPAPNLPYYSTFELRIQHTDEVAILIKDVARINDELKEKSHALVKELIDGVLKNCTTLKQAIEVWPSVLDFIPKEAVARHKEPTTKISRSKPQIDLADDMKAELIKMRMQNGY